MTQPISQDPTSLKETWLELDGRRLLYRTNADAPPPTDAPTLIHVHGFAISGRYLMPTAWRLAPEFRTFVVNLLVAFRRNIIADRANCSFNLGRKTTPLSLQTTSERAKGNDDDERVLETLN